VNLETRNPEIRRRVAGFQILSRQSAMIFTHRQIFKRNSSADRERSDRPARFTWPSIAVLPLDNRSARQDDAFFVDGIQPAVMLDTRLRRNYDRTNPA
jgi:hypothetical protein